MGSRQFLVLLRCKDKSFVTEKDVRQIFNYSLNIKPRYSDVSRKMNRGNVELEKIVAKGYLKKISQHKFVLTDMGQRIVDNL